MVVSKLLELVALVLKFSLSGLQGGLALVELIFKLLDGGLGGLPFAVGLGLL